MVLAACSCPYPLIYAGPLKGAEQGLKPAGIGQRRILKLALLLTEACPRCILKILFFPFFSLLKTSGKVVESSEELVSSLSKSLYYNE